MQGHWAPVLLSWHGPHKMESTRRRVCNWVYMCVCAFVLVCLLAGWLAWFGLVWFGLVFWFVCLFVCLLACLLVCLFSCLAVVSLFVRLCVCYLFGFLLVCFLRRAKQGIVLRRRTKVESRVRFWEAHSPFICGQSYKGRPNEELP